MKLREQVKPLSYLKAHAPDVIRDLAANREPVIITLRGKAQAVLQDIAGFEETQETIALLKVLALSNKDVEDGRTRSAAAAFKRIRRRTKA